uniref:CCT domain-containing protein n=1 Tax=Oryza glumipatula TaxID=40148 RepID=A0A0D9YL74_9ORYZ
MARIFSIDVPPPPPPPPVATDEPWITDTLPFVPYDNSMSYTNYCYYPEMFEDANPDISKEMTTIGGEDLLVDNANQQDYFQAWTNSFDSVALMEPGALQEPSYLDLDPSCFDLGSYLDPDHQQMASSSCSDIALLSDTSFLQPLNMSNAPYVQLPMMDANINNEIGAATSSSDLAQLIPQSSDHSLLQPLNINDETAYDQLPVIDTNTSSNNNTSSEFPCVNFQSSNTGSLLGGSSNMFDGQDQQTSHIVLPEKSCPDPEKRQRAVQRYKEKKSNRRFVKQIMYASRKATADTRRRVRGRFVKASLEQGTSSNDNKQPKHEGN